MEESSKLAVQSLTLPTGTPVQLEFRGAGRSWLLPAVVVQGASCGIRVMFHEPQPEIFRDLIELAQGVSRPVVTSAAAESLRAGC